MAECETDEAEAQRRAEKPMTAKMSQYFLDCLGAGTATDFGEAALAAIITATSKKSLARRLSLYLFADALLDAAAAFYQLDRMRTALKEAKTTYGSCAQMRALGWPAG